MKISLKTVYKLYHSMYALEVSTHGVFTPRAAFLRNKIETVGNLLDASGLSYSEEA